MNYLNHETEFGNKFNLKLNDLENFLKEIYQIKEQYQSHGNDNSIRLHSSTLDYKSTFACTKAILENKITMGSLVKSYEKYYSQYLNGSYKVLSCNSGSSANLLAISTLVQTGKLKKGDHVIVPALSWSTTVFPLIQYGLIPIFCDCNNFDFNISLSNLQNLIEEYKPKALMLIHTYGCPADMDEISNITKKNKMLLIEDTCESMGASWSNKKVGTFGDVSTFSTYYSHHICTLEGGLTCFKEDSDLTVAESIRSHGWLRHLSQEDKIFKEFSNLDPGFIFNFVGYNLRLSEPQAAIGIEQLQQLDVFIKNRSKAAQLYTSFFMDYQDSIQILKPKEKASSSWFGFPLVLTGRLKGKRNELRKKLMDNNIESRPFLAGNFSIQPVVNNFKHFKDKDLKVSQSISDDGLAIPCHQDINESNISKITSIIKTFLQ